MCGAIPPLLQYAFMARCLVKHRGNFTFTFNFKYEPVNEYMHKSLSHGSFGVR
jgi:hypothetical protein